MPSFYFIEIEAKICWWWRKLELRLSCNIFDRNRRQWRHSYLSVYRVKLDGVIEARLCYYRMYIFGSYARYSVKR